MSRVGEMVAIDAVPLTHGLDYLVETQPAQQPLLPPQVATGLGALGDVETHAFQKSLAAQQPAMPRFRPGRRGRVSQTRGDETTVRRLGIGPAKLTGPRRQQLVVGHPVKTVATAEIAGTA